MLSYTMTTRKDHIVNECSPSIGGVGGDYLRGGREEDTYLVIPTLHHTVG